MDLRIALAKKGVMNIASGLIAHFVKNEVPFSSGEVAAYIRTYAPGEAFSVANLGSKIRDLYDAGEMPSYSSGYPVRVPRTTSSHAHTMDGNLAPSKTPPGTTVFVYAPTEDIGRAHDFEVIIPDPPGHQVVKNVPTVKMMVQQGDSLETYVSGVMLYVPKKALDLLLVANQRALRGGSEGDPVYVVPSEDEIRVSVRDPGGARAVRPWEGRGRIAVSGIPWANEREGRHEVRLVGNVLVVSRS